MKWKEEGVREREEKVKESKGGGESRWNGSNPVKRKSKRKQRKEKEEGLESKWITDENEIWKKCIVS